MDLNEDGFNDILSGSYSRQDPDKSMAGLFQVFWGNSKGEFAPATPLTDADGEPLITSSKRNGLETICTRPTAADLDGDDKLDLVVGCASGGFYFFKGHGKGVFAKEAKPIMSGGRPISVREKSDPFVVDWDGDGDMDILSGSGLGGVYLIANEGTASSPRFVKQVPLIAGLKEHNYDTKMEDGNVDGPSVSTRVWAEDLNGDGLLDLLVGDSVSMICPAKGVDKKEALSRLNEWQKEYQSAQEELSPKMSKLYRQMDKLGRKKDDESIAKREELEAKIQELSTSLEGLNAKRSEFVNDIATGYIWVYYQKPVGQVN